MSTIVWQSITNEFVGNKSKRWISKRVFQENIRHQIFRKTKISYLLIRTRTYTYQGVRNVRFSENLTYFVFLKAGGFEICPFALLPLSYVIKCFRKVWMNSSKHSFLISNSSQFFLITRKNTVLHYILVDNHIDNVKSVQIRSFSGMYFPAFSPKLYLETFHAVWNLGNIGI